MLKPTVNLSTLSLNPHGHPLEALQELLGKPQAAHGRLWEDPCFAFLLLFRQKAALPAPEAAREADEAGGEGVRGWGVIGSL